MTPEELFDLSNDVAVVTGAGRGIGEGIAHVLASAGAAVVLAARRGDEIDRVARDLQKAGHRAIAVPTDVTDEAAVEALAQAAIDEFGRLSIWVNNAGGSPVQSRLTKLSRADWDAAIDLNLTAVWVCTRIASDRMDEGSIINISSLAAHGPTPGSGHYAAAKAGTNSLTQTFSRELAPRVRVNGISPGAIPTEIMMKATGMKEEDLPNLVRGARIAMKRLGTPEDIGAAALFLASKASSWITGETLVVTGGMSGLG
jgi:NAD(P)-dependent dehydrogenase (short-subunit alcohol dehydrogenase family)